MKKLSLCIIFVSSYINAAEIPETYNKKEVLARIKLSRKKPLFKEIFSKEEWSGLWQQHYDKTMAIDILQKARKRGRVLAYFLTVNEHPLVLSDGDRIVLRRYIHKTYWDKDAGPLSWLYNIQGLTLEELALVRMFTGLPEVLHKKIGKNRYQDLCIKRAINVLTALLWKKIIYCSENIDKNMIKDRLDAIRIMGSNIEQEESLSTIEEVTSPDGSSCSII